MNVSLPPELELLVQNSVASGRYASTDSLLEHAVQLLFDAKHQQYQEAKLEILRNKVASAIADLDVGRGVLVTETNYAEFVEGIERHGRRKLKGIG